MSLKPPKLPPRIYVTLMDADTKNSKTFTLYHVTLEEVRQRIQEIFQEEWR